MGEDDTCCGSVSEGTPRRDDLEMRGVALREFVAEAIVPAERVAEEERAA